MYHDGQVYEYNSSGNIAFRSCPQCPIVGTVVLIGGLGDNMFTLPYWTRLSDFLGKLGLSLVIPQLRSMPAFNLAPVDWDVEDIHDVVSAIDHPVILIGHSTGCNDALLYLASGASPNVVGIVLQAPVSDTEFVSRSAVEDRLDLIRESDANSKYIEFPDGTFWLKERYVSLYSIKGKEDLFSTYIDSEAYARWRGDVPIMVVISGMDEFCSNPPIGKFKCMGSVHVINNGNHSLMKEEAQLEFLDLLDTFFEEIKLFEKL